MAASLGLAVAVAFASQPSDGWSTPYAFLSGNVTESGYTESADVPDVAVSADGDMAAVWLETATDSGTTTTSVAADVNNGTGWGNPDEPLATDGSLADPFNTTRTGGTEVDQPQVVEDADGDALAAWIENGEVWTDYAAGGAAFPAGGSAIGTASGGWATEVHVAMVDGYAVAVWATYDSVSGTWDVEYADTYGSASGQFGDASALVSGLTADPEPSIAMDPATGNPVAVFIEAGVSSPGIWYAYGNGTEGAAPFNTPEFGAEEVPDPSDPVVAVNGSGDFSAAWAQSTGAGNSVVYDGFMPAANADDNVGFVPISEVGTSTDGIDPSIAMSSISDDDTTAVAYYDASAGNVVVATESSSNETSNPWINYAQTASEPTAFPQQPQLTMSGTTAGEDMATMLWQTGSGATPNQIEAITSDDTGSFTNSSVQTIQDGSSITGPGGQTGDSAVGTGCSGANCDALTADSGGDLVATWLQTDTNGDTQVAADCYQASDATSGPVTATTTTGLTANSGSFNAASCVSPYADATTTATTSTTPPPTTTQPTTGTTPTTTTPATTTPSTTTTSTAPPVLGESSDVAKASGTILVKLPGTNRFVPVSSEQQIPFGAVINATNGTVTTTVALPNGQTSTATFWAGEFTLHQAGSGAIDATLSGGSFTGCPAAPTGRRSSSHSSSRTAAAVTSARPQAKTVRRKSPGTVVRSLWANAKGSYTTSGHSGAAAVLGTEWLTRDQCDGTYFSVRTTTDDPHGEIRVTVFFPHRHTVLLKRGHSLLAPARGFPS